MEQLKILLDGEIRTAAEIKTNTLLNILPIIKKYDQRAAIVIWGILKNRGIDENIIKSSY